MKFPFEETLIEVWRQSLVENATVVELEGRRYPVRRTPKRSLRQVDFVFDGNHYPVRRTPKRGLRQVDFVFDGNEIRGLEQNPDTRSRWAQMARSGKKVIQFLSEGGTWQLWWTGR